MADEFAAETKIDALLLEYPAEIKATQRLRATIIAWLFPPDAGIRVRASGESPSGRISRNSR